MFFIDYSLETENYRHYIYGFYCSIDYFGYVWFKHYKS